MKKEIADRWVAALRSGEYAQAEAALHTADDRFCCLGVLCDLAGDVSKRTEYSGNYNYDGVSDYLPNSVMHWAGMASSDGSLDGQKALYELNDDDGFSFSEIADVIEANWEKL